MKQNIIFVVALCMLLITCSDSNDPIKEVEKKDPFISLKKSNIDFTNEGGSEAILIESNVTWTAKSSASWCTVTPSSGNNSTESITLSVAENKDYDNRSCMVTIESGGVSKTVTVSQSQENAIILSEKDLDLSSKAQSVEVEVKTNIDYEIIIPEDAKHWVSHSKTRALRTETVVLDIAENKNDKMRITKIQINDKSTSLQETITINQRSNVPGVYWVSKMGTLGSLLNQTQKDTITTMIVKGEINKADFDVMKLEMPKLKYIDLKEVKCEGDKIPDFAFGGYSFNKVITTIILPESIKEIGISAFSNCYGLTGNLTLPEGVTTIGNSAFISCSGFTGNLILPNKISTIGANAFQDCSGFTGLILPDGLTTIGMSAFAYCSGFTGNLTLPDGITTISDGAFGFCHGFTGNLTLPDGITTIGMAAFSHCSGFTGLTIGKSLTTIDNGAFYGCENLSGNIVFPNRLSSIRQNAFTNSYNVAAFQFPHTIPLGYYPNMLPSGATVKVPTEAVATYKAANGWKDYNIVGY